MAKPVKKHSKKIGFPPGTLVHTGEKKVNAVRITLIDYDEQNFQEKQVSAVEECFQFKKTPTVTWVNIDGLHEVDIIERLGKQFDIHPLVLEDILNTDQRPKFEDFEKYFFIVLKMLSYDDKNQTVEEEQVSLVLGENFVISLQERIGDVFEPIRDRIRTSKGRIRKTGADYLCYSLIDTVVDNYFSILEKTGDKIESMEEKLVS